ncbi:MAG: hypothetical protein KY437_04005 [Actinobacteria bacterium]|nr:hypothetical protein [Actinomycetota bacterium]
MPERTPEDVTDPWLGLEHRLHAWDEVIAVTFLTDELGEPSEIQVFTEHDADVGVVRQRVTELLRGSPSLPSDIPVAVLALAPKRQGDAARPRAVAVGTRPAGRRVEIRRVVAASAKERSAVQVILGYADRRASGFARNGVGPWGVSLAAQATIDAVETLLGRPGWLRLVGAAVEERFGRSVVAVLIDTSDDESVELLGATSASEVPFHEAAVQATLDAVNRQIALRLL